MYAALGLWPVRVRRDGRPRVGGGGAVVMLALSFEYRRCFPLFFSAMDNVFKGCALVVECF